jgi:hyperosmotically inducible protein
VSSNESGRGYGYLVIEPSLADCTKEVLVKLPFACKVFVSSLVLTFGLVLQASAQSSDPGASASDSMKSAGQSMKQAGSDMAGAAEDTYHGAVTAVRDTEISAKVKTALHEDRATEHSDIHVSTSAGIVTLRGSVATQDVAMRAVQVAEAAKGVKQVNNELKVSDSATLED